MTRIDLHLGVHKTASTHLQKYWVACREAGGAKKGTWCPALDELRPALTPVCGEGGGPAARAERERVARAFVAGQAALGKRLVLSDENFLGSCELNLERRALYPDARARLGRLAEVLQEAAPREIRVLISVRDYGDYIRSAWCEAVRHVPYRPFRKMSQGMAVEDRGWEHLVADIRHVFPDSPIVCWRYEHLAAVLPVLSAELFARPAAALPAPDGKRERQSFARMAVRLLDDVFQRAGSEVATQVRGSAEKIVNGPQMPRFDPWSPDEKAAFARAYERSLLQIAALDGVTLMQP